MLLHKKCSRPLCTHRDVVHAVSNFRGRIRNILRMQSLVDRLPGQTTIIRAKRASSGNRNVDSLWITGIKNHRVQAHSPRTRLPLRTGSMPAQSGKFLPGFAAIFRFEKRGILNAGKDSVRFRERRLDMPDTLELPGMLRTIIKLMRRQRFSGLRRNVVDKFVALSFRHSIGTLFFAWRSSRLEPRLAAVIRTLNHLPKPPAGLRSINPVGIKL